MTNQTSAARSNRPPPAKGMGRRQLGRPGGVGRRPPVTREILPVLAVVSALENCAAV